MAIANHRDASGNLIVFVHSGSVEGIRSGLPFGHSRRDDSWTEGTMDPSVPNNWDKIVSSGWHASLNVDTDTGDVVQSRLGSALIGAGAAFIVAGISSGGVIVTPGKDPEGNPAIQISPKPQQ